MSYYILRTSESARRAMGLSGIAFGKAPADPLWFPSKRLAFFPLVLWPLGISVKDRSHSSLPFGPERNRLMHNVRNIYVDKPRVGWVGSLQKLLQGPQKCSRPPLFSPHLCLVLLNFCVVLVY